MNSDKVRIGLAFLLIVLVLSVLTLIFWDFVRDTIVVPVDYLMWLIGLIIRSIPQGVFLGVLLFFGLILSLNTLDRVRSKPESPNYEPSQAQGDTRYHRWLMLVSKQSLSPFYREIFASEARNLILSMLAYDHGIDSAKAEARVKDGTLVVPESIRALIELRDVRLSQPPANRIQAILRRLRLLNAQPPSDSQFDRLVTEVVDFVERHGDPT